VEPQMELAAHTFVAHESARQPRHESWGKERALLAMPSRMPANVQHCLVIVYAKATKLFNSLTSTNR